MEEREEEGDELKMGSVASYYHVTLNETADHIHRLDREWLCLRGLVKRCNCPETHTLVVLHK